MVAHSGVFSPQARRIPSRRAAPLCLPRLLCPPPPVQGYLAHKKHPPPRTLQKDYLGSCLVPSPRLLSTTLKLMYRVASLVPSIRRGGAADYERGTPVARRLIDSCITQLKAQGPSRTCNESQEEEKEVARRRRARGADLGVRESAVGV